MKILNDLGEAARKGSSVEVGLSGGQAITGVLVKADENGVIIKQPNGTVYLRSEAILFVKDNGFGIDVIPAQALTTLPGGKGH